MNNYDIVIPVLLEDAKKVFENIDMFFKNFTFKKIVFIGNDQVNDFVKKANNDRLVFMNENDIFPGMNYKSVNEIIEKRIGKNKRAGWYLQQFIKLAYCYVCDDEYYLTWDSDTVPVRKIEFFENNKPCFDLKTEYHRPYFDTIKNLLGLDKQIKRSFIAEHNFFNVECMKAMIQKIMENDNIPGETFYEKSINAVNVKDLGGSGFAEPEIYGTYVMANYSNKYILRNWKSLREGIFYIKMPLTDLSTKWVAKKYHAISFEKHDTLTKLYRIWNNEFTFKYIPIGFVTTVMYPYMMLRKYVFKRH